METKLCSESRRGKVTGKGRIGNRSKGIEIGPKRGAGRWTRHWIHKKTKSHHRCMSRSMNKDQG